jgi:uncharacterized protein YxjI
MFHGREKKVLLTNLRPKYEISGFQDFEISGFIIRLKSKEI